MQTIDLSSAFAIHHITSWPKNYILPNVMHTWAVALLPNMFRQQTGLLRYLKAKG